VVKVIWHKAVSLPHTDGSIVFVRWRQCAPLYYTQFLLDSASQTAWRSVYCRFALLTAESPYFPMGHHSPFKIAHWRWGNLDPIQHMVPWSNSCPHPKRHLDRFTGFCRAHDGDRPTDRLTAHATASAPTGRIYIVLRCRQVLQVRQQSQCTLELNAEVLCSPDGQLHELASPLSRTVDLWQQQSQFWISSLTSILNFGHHP